MGFRIKFDVESDFVAPKLEDLDIPNVQVPTQTELPSTAIASRASTPKTSSVSPGASSNSGGLSWDGWTISLDLSNLETAVGTVDEALKVIDKITKNIATVLKLLRLFTSDLFSISRLLKMILKIVVKQLKNIIEQLAGTGLYFSVIGLDNFQQRKRGGFPINGGYREFVSRVSNTCLSSKDPDAPKYGEKDQVGGAILAMLAGTDDPELLANIAHNINILFKFFKYPPMFAAPPKNVTANPGFYDYEPSGDKKLGVKLTWAHPGTVITKFFVYRCKFKGGIKQAGLVDGDYKNFNVYDDDRGTSDEGMWEPVEVKVKISKGTTKGESYSYTDFNVEDTQNYFYKVYSSFGNKFAEGGTKVENMYDRRLTAPNGSKTVHARPIECIPISELDKYTTLDEGGNYVPPFDLEGEWNSVTVRSLLGKPIDKLLDLIDSLADKLDTLVITGSDAIGNYIKFFEKKIKKYLDITNKVLEIVKLILTYNLKGSFLKLTLPPEAGGMANFVSRFKSAELPPVDEIIKKSDDSGGSDGTTLADNTEVGIMFGIILLYGAPTVDGDYFKQLIPASEIDEVQAKFESAQKAKDTFLKLLGLDG